MFTSCSVSFFLSDDGKQDYATATANIKRLVEPLKKVLTSALSKIRQNTDDFAEQYGCASALYFM